MEIIDLKGKTTHNDGYLVRDVLVRRNDYDDLWGCGGGVLNPQTKRNAIIFEPSHPQPNKVFPNVVSEFILKNFIIWLHYIYDNISKTGYKRPEIMK